MYIDLLAYYNAHEKWIEWAEGIGEGDVLWDEENIDEVFYGPAMLT